MIKKILYIFIPALAVLLMSHNVNAIDLNLPVEFDRFYRQPYYSYIEAGSSSSSSFTNGQLIRNTDSPNVNKIQFKNSSNADFNVSRGDFIVINFYVQQNTLLYSNENVYPYSFISTIGSAPTCDILKIEFEDQPYLEQTNVKSRWNGIITCRVSSDTTNPSINLLVRSNLLNLQNPTESIRVGFSNLNIYKSVPSVNDEQEEATQDAADNSATSGGNSASNSQNATSSLLSVITSGIGAITSASPTNCKINGNMGNLNVGNIDLCANPVPTFMALIGSIIAVLVVLPLVILLFNRFISIIRSFQR